MRICRCLVTDPSDSSRTFHEGDSDAKAPGGEEVEASSASASEPDHTAGAESGCQFGHEGPLSFAEGLLESKDADGDGGEAAAAAEVEREEARPRRHVEVGKVAIDDDVCDPLPRAGAARERRLPVLPCEHDGVTAGVAPRWQRQQARPP